MIKAVKAIMLSAYITVALSLGIVYAATSGVFTFGGNLTLLDVSSLFYIDPVYTVNPDTGNVEYFTADGLPNNMAITKQSWGGATFNVEIAKLSAVSGGSSITTLETSFVNMTTYRWQFVTSAAVPINVTAVSTKGQAVVTSNPEATAQIPTGQYWATDNKNLFKGTPAFRVYTVTSGGAAGQTTGTITIEPNQTAKIQFAANGKLDMASSDTAWFRTYFMAIDANNQRIKDEYGVNVPLQYFNMLVTFKGTAAFPTNPVPNNPNLPLNDPTISFGMNFWYKANRTGTLMPAPGTTPTSACWNAANVHDYPWEVA